MKDGSFFCVPNDLVDVHLATLSGAAVKTYLTLKKHMNQGTDEAFPSYEHIQVIAGLAPASVAKAVKELVDIGLVTVRKQGRRSFYHFSNRSGSETEVVQKLKRTSSKTEVGPVQKLKSNKTKEQDELTRETPIVPQGGRVTVNYSQQFETFWKAYGPEGSKYKAWQAWQRHAKGVDLDIMLAGVTAYRGSERPQKGYVQNAVTWINGRGWETDWKAYAVQNGTSTNGHYMTAAEKHDDLLRRFARKGSDDGQPATIRASLAGGIVPPGDHR